MAVYIVGTLGGKPAKELTGSFRHESRHSSR
jgi:hypothetical protein